MSNHHLRYRPLRAGIGIWNPLFREPGTLGCFGDDVAGDRWLISCYHVLCRNNAAPFAPGEPIHQPTVSSVLATVANLDTAKANRTDDYAAAKLVPGIASTSEILSIGTVSPAVSPAVGMQVLKSGATTGVTEGRITAMMGNLIAIEPDPSFPSDYHLCDGGDSGAVWIQKQTGAAVGLHLGSPRPGEARAIAMTAVLTGLGLTLVTR